MQQQKLQLPQPPLFTPPLPPPRRPPDYFLMQRLWQLPPWTALLGNVALLNTPPPVIQPPKSPQIQLMLPEWDELFPRRGGTRTDIAPPPQPAPQDLKTWLEVQEIKKMPPGLRELYSALLGAGRYAVITPALDVLARWVKREDPTRGLEEFRRRAEAASYASPWAHLVGQGIGLAGVAGLAAEGLMARGVGATGIERLVSGLRASAKPAAVGAAAGAGAGATEGVLTGRDPFAEAAKYGSIGFLTGLGGVPKERLIAAGLLGATVGGSTAKEYGVGKGLETGSTVFLLPIAAPVERGLGGFVLGTRRGLRTELLTESGAAPSQTAPRVELPTVQDVKMYMLLTRRSFSDVVADMARQTPPDQRRDLFTNVVEMALDRLRAGYDRDAVLAVLKNVRQKLDPAMRSQFDEVLRQYGLTEVKYTTPEYQLTEESAAALNQFLKTRTPEYQLSDDAAKLLDQLLRMEPPRSYTLLRTRSEPPPRGESYMLLRTRSEPEYVLTDETAQRLDQFLQQETRLADRLAPIVRQDQLLRSRTAVAQITAPRTVAVTAPAAGQTATTTTTTTPATTPVQTPTTTTTTTPPPETPPKTPSPETPLGESPPRTPPPYIPPYIPPWMLSLPVSVALPILAQMGIRLPPPPNPSLPLGTYLKMLRLPGMLGRQREVYVLI